MEKSASVVGTDIHEVDGYKHTTPDGAADSTLARQTRVKRIFSNLQIFFFALTYMSSWEAVASNLVTVFTNGGPRALVWGGLIVIVGALAQSASMAEMAAMQPIAGAQYHWTAALASPKHRRLIAWLQGWMTWFAWISLLAGVTNFTAYVTQGIVTANYPAYEPKAWHLTLIMFAVLVIQSLMNTFTFWLIPWIELFAGILHVGLFIIFVAVLLATTKDKNSVDFVFFGTSTSSGWTNDYISWNLGFLGPVWAFVGFDAAVHMSEEVRRARHAVPRAMFWSIAINGAMAYAFIVTILFCMGSLDDILNSSYPMLTILLNSTGSLQVATLLCVGLLIVSLACNLGTIASVSRLTWSWARDGALPHHFSYINPKYRVPIRALWLPVFLTMLLSLLNIASTAAFGAFTALAGMAIYSSYMIAISCMLYARLTTADIRFAPDWTLGRWGVPINIFALVYTAYTLVFLPFPASLPVSGPTMNYALPIFAFTVVFSVGGWMVWGRRRWGGLNEKVVEFVLAESG